MNEYTAVVLLEERSLDGRYIEPPVWDELDFDLVLGKLVVLAIFLRFLVKTLRFS